MLKQRKTSFEKTPIGSRKTNLFKSDRGNEFYNSIFQTSLNNNNMKHFPRNTYLGVLLAERFNCTIRDLLKKPVFEKGESNWIDFSPIIT